MSVFCFGFQSQSKIALALLPSQSSLDQSECMGEGCGASCLQHEQVRPKHSHAFLRVGLIMSILFMSIILVSMVLYIVGLYRIELMISVGPSGPYFANSMFS